MSQTKTKNIFNKKHLISLLVAVLLMAGFGIGYSLVTNITQRTDFAKSASAPQPYGGCAYGTGTFGAGDCGLTEADIAALVVTCTPDPSLVNSTTTCSFTLTANKVLPTDFKLSIGSGAIDVGGSTPAKACTLTGNTTTCTNIPTGNSVGNIKIFGNLGTGSTATKTATTSTVNITGTNFGNINWNFTHDQGGTSPLFRSTDNTSITVNNFRTIFDPTPTSNTRYTCTLEYRNFNDRLAVTPTWTTLTAPSIPYTTGSGTTQGCTVNLSKTQRANVLNHSLRLTITDTTITSPSSTNPNSYLFYNEYIYRFQGAGVAVGG